MSIVFYGFRSKNRIHFTKQVRYIRKITSASIDKYSLDLIAPEGIDIQWFETSEGIVFRVLETGYGMKNKLWDNPKYFPGCAYDDRSDPVPEQASIDLINEIDSLISPKKYKIIVIIPGRNK